MEVQGCNSRGLDRSLGGKHHGLLACGEAGFELHEERDWRFGRCYRCWREHRGDGAPQEHGGEHSDAALGSSAACRSPVL